MKKMIPMKIGFLDGSLFLHALFKFTSFIKRLNKLIYSLRKPYFHMKYVFCMHIFLTSSLIIFQRRGFVLSSPE